MPGAVAPFAPPLCTPLFGAFKGLKNSKSFTDALFALLLFTTHPTIINTCSLAALVAITENVFLALETPICGLATTGE